MKTLLAICVLFFVTGCTTLSKPLVQEYVDADEATLDSVGAEWLGYVEADEKLDEAQKNSRRVKRATWALRIKAMQDALDKEE